MKRMIIIGAGVSGLSAGIYGRLNGFDTEIYEMHSIAGGECTGWRRKEYYFDGCIHWLMGTKPGTALNEIWREVGALDDTIQIVNNDIFYCFEEEGKRVCLYRDPIRLESHLKEVAPEDSERIESLCKTIRAMKYLSMPVAKPIDMMNAIDMAKMLFRMMPVMKYIPKLERVTASEYVAQFKSPILRKALSKAVPPFYKATALLATLGSLANGDSGWPLGGSIAMAERMEKKYLDLGGKISYKAKVDKVIVKNGRAIGILLADGREILGDYIISTADGHATLFDMLGGKYLDEKLKALYSDREAYPLYTSFQVSLGVDCDLSKYPHTLYVKLEEKINGGGATNDYLGFKHFCYDNNLMPEGKSAVTVMLGADFDWWKERYNDKDAYIKEKERIGAEVASVLEKTYPETKGKVEVIDVATPMTYVRYCNAWRGAWMAFGTTPKGKIQYISGKLPGLDGFYLSGQWTMPPGGLPTAVITARWTIQRICGLEKRKFDSK